MYDALTWRNADEINFNSILTSEANTHDILIKESDLLRLIQLATPNQKIRRIRLVG